MAETTTARPVKAIAAEVLANWRNPHFGAVPYLRAMTQLDRVTDMYGLDEGRTIVLYFLANAGTWRGEAARRIKTELRAMTRGAA